MKENTEITVLGAGYVGLTTATLFANAGIRVHLIEPNQQRLEVIKSGKSFFYEYGINELLSPVVSDGTLHVTDKYDECIPTSDIVFSCVGTPDKPDGSSNLSYVFSAAEETAKLAKSGAVYVQKSTVPVGTGTKVEKLFADANADIAYVSNPEFLREGTAVSDTLYFDRIVAGGSSGVAVNIVLECYRQLESRRDNIADKAVIKPAPQEGKYIATTLNSAELVKVASNAFLALKISFANSIAKLADAANADINEVMDAVGADPRIGRAFLNAGRGYGGGCFPKDVSGLISSALEYGVDLDIMSAAQDTNASMPSYIVEKLSKEFDGNFGSKYVAVLGLSFKAGTSDVRKSPGISIANTLANMGAVVAAYDPEANEEAREELQDSVRLHSAANQALDGAEAVVIATDWPEFINRKADSFGPSVKIFVDAMNRFSQDDVKGAGLVYIGVGRS